MDLNLDLKKFNKDGYLLVRNVFSKEEIKTLRNKYKGMVASSEKKNLVDSIEGFNNHKLLIGDLCSFDELKEFDYLVFDNRIISIVKALLGDEIFYFGDSNTQSGSVPGGNHKDNRIEDRENPLGKDWKGNYPLIRVAIYLQDAEKHSGGVKIMPGSHKIPTSKFFSPGLNIPSKVGDIVIWKLTTTHSGHAKRLKFFNNFSIHPRLEYFIPKFMEKASKEERISFFIVYGAKSDHLSRYLKYFVSRDDNRKYLKNSRINEEINKLALKRGVTLVKPSNEYGSNL